MPLIQIMKLTAFYMAKYLPNGMKNKRTEQALKFLTWFKEKDLVRRIKRTMGNQTNARSTSRSLSQTYGLRMISSRDSLTQWNNVLKSRTLIEF